MKSFAAGIVLALCMVRPAAAEEPGAPAPSAPAGQVLPDVTPEPGETGPRTVVRGFRILGSTAFSEEELRAVVGPWVGREITTEDLVSVRNALTRLYVDHGYVNSGAVVPDQDLAGGIVELWIVEGSLHQIDVRGNRWYRASVLRDRLSVGVKKPLEVATLERNLQLLQQDPRIRRVYASLLPGERHGEAVLVVRIEEESPYDLSLDVSNWAPVSFGAYQGRVKLADENLTGLGDVLDTRVRVAAGLVRVDGQYDVPINRWGTRLKVRGEWADSKVKEDPFDTLDIETDYVAGRVALEQPLYRSSSDRLALEVTGEWRRSKTCFDVAAPVLGCDPFSAIESGAVDGQTTVSMLRVAADWSRRSERQVFAARSTFNFGLPVLGAESDVVADGKFFTWLGQAQWARRWGFFDIQTIVRADVQLASEPVPSLERLPVGGHYSVRGYRENQLVRDQGAIGSVEVRVPVWKDEGRPILEVAPFFDFGWSKNKDRPSPGPETISSAGVGLRWNVTRDLFAQVYWGHQFEKEILSSGNLQDDGVQFMLRWDAF